MSLAPLAPPTESFGRPPQGRRLARFYWGFALPFRLLRTLRARPEDWAALKRVWRRQAAAALAASLLILAALGYGLYRVGQWAKAHPDVNVKISDGAFEIVSSALAVCALCEWLVIALSREHHEQLSRRFSIAVGLAPEDPETPPRIRLDLRWIGRRMRRWGRGVKALIGALPAIIVLSIPFGGGVGSDRANAFFGFLWTFYWGTILACAKTGHAWRTEGDAAAPPPWFVKLLMRYPLIDVYGRIVARLSRASFPPAREVEPHIYEFAGLALARLVVGLPGVYLLVRPSLPVAAAQILATPFPTEPAQAPANCTPSNTKLGERIEE